jgi:hypothetical protein
MAMSAPVESKFDTPALFVASPTRVHTAGSVSVM